MNVLNDFIKKYGGRKALAEDLGVSHAMVYQWLSGKRPVSAQMTARIVRLSKGAIRPEEINPTVDWSAVRG